MPHVPCPRCDGSGVSICPTCKGLDNRCPTCGGYNNCTRCGGSGCDKASGDDC